MRRSRSGGCSRPAAFLWIAAGLLAASPAAAPAPRPGPAAGALALQQKRKKPEEIPEVDPYTKGDPEVMAEMGYRRFAPFVFVDDMDTAEVKQVLGDAQILWVETAHFRIGSSLEPYTVEQDRDERAKIKQELGRLSKRLPNVKKSVRELDRWLLLHLWAQRLEEVYADFCEAIAVSDGDFPTTGAGKIGSKMGNGPFLGQASPFTVLLLQRQSELGRFTAKYVGHESKHSQRWYFERSGSMFFGVSFEAMLGTYKNDTALHCAVVNGVVQNFIDGFRSYSFQSPVWFKHGMAHVFSRRVDERFNVYGGGLGSPGQDEDGWDWMPRVKARVKYEYFPSWDTMFGWKVVGDLKDPDHMIAWSRVEFLLQEPRATREFLVALKEPVAAGTDAHPILLEREKKAVPECWDASLEELEAAWAKWVKKTYRSR